jgi:hypothetical protein
VKFAHIADKACQAARSGLVMTPGNPVPGRG